MTRPPALLCIVTATACATSACASGSRATGTLAVVGGAAATIAGGAMLIALQSPGDDTDNNGVDDFPENDIACALGGCLLAAGLVVAGLVTTGVGFVALSRADDAPPATAPPTPTPPGGPPGETAEVDIRLVAPLPEMPCDAMTLQFAKQARAAARRGACDIARMITRRIAERDRRYAAALRASPALARCP